MSSSEISGASSTNKSDAVQQTLVESPPARTRRVVFRLGSQLLGQAEMGSSEEENLVMDLSDCEEV